MELLPEEREGKLFPTPRRKNRYRRLKRTTSAVATIASGFQQIARRQSGCRGREQWSTRSTVTNGGSLASVGDEVTGNFCYDTDIVPGIKMENFADYQVAKECKIVVIVGTHKATARNLDVSIYNNFGGNLEDVITISGVPARLDGIEYPEGVVGIVLATGPGNTKVFRSLNLREQFKIDEFDAASFGEVRIDGSSDGQVLHFTITSMKVVN